MIREIVQIDETLCDGCGLCVPACHEGALQIVNGKARLVADLVCDGLGACLGHCPRGAIRIEHREAEPFSEQAVAEHMAKHAPPPPACPTAAFSVAVPAASGCPGSRFVDLRARREEAPAVTSTPRGPARASELANWPVQLNLLSAHAPLLRGASLLIAADCVPVAYAEFHGRLLRGRTVVVGCPKLDDVASYVEKLIEIMRANELRDVVVARMEVPCCGGIVAAAREARRRAGVDLEITEVIISIRGELLVERKLPAEAAELKRGA